MSKNWFYVNHEGTTSQAVTQDDLKHLYQSKKITDDTYVWNGTTVNTWMKVSSTANTSAGLLQYIKAGAPRAAPPPAIVPAAPKIPTPAPGIPGRKSGGGGGGGRAALLDAIRQGNKLKKTSAAPVAAKPTGADRGGGGRAPAKMSMQDEMRARLQKRTSGATKSSSPTVNRSSTTGFGGPSNRRPSANVPVPSASNGRVVPPPGGRSPPGQGARGGGGFGIKKAVTAPNGSPGWGSKSVRGAPGGGGGGGNAKVDALVSKLQNLSPSGWQFKAIEKILN